MKNKQKYICIFASCISLIQAPIYFRCKARESNYPYLVQVKVEEDTASLTSLENAMQNRPISNVDLNIFKSELMPALAKASVKIHFSFVSSMGFANWRDKHGIKFTKYEYLSEMMGSAEFPSDKEGMDEMLTAFEQDAYLNNGEYELPFFANDKLIRSNMFPEGTYEGWFNRNAKFCIETFIGKPKLLNQFIAKLVPEGQLCQEAFDDEKMKCLRCLEGLIKSDKELLSEECPKLFQSNMPCFIILPQNANVDVTQLTHSVFQIFVAMNSALSEVADGCAHVKRLNDEYTKRIRDAIKTDQKIIEMNFGCAYNNKACFFTNNPSAFKNFKEAGFDSLVCHLGRFLE